MSTYASLLVTLAIGAGSLAILLTIYRQTKTKGRWGLNLQPVTCPACGTRRPFVRWPASPQQALWGGGTCRSCGTEMDKWGRRISSHS